MLAAGLTNEQLTCRVRWNESLMDAEWRHLFEHRCHPLFLEFEPAPEFEPMAIAA
jgi:hypothetical protein